MQGNFIARTVFGIAVFGLAISLALQSDAGIVTLSITAEETGRDEFGFVLGTWEVRAEITDTSVLTDPAGNTILGIASFMIDVHGIDGARVDSASVEAPFSQVGLGFSWDRSVSPGLPNGLLITASQNTFIPSFVLTGVGLWENTVGFVTWDHPVLLASGTYSTSDPALDPVQTVVVQERLTGGGYPPDSGFNLLYGSGSVFVDPGKVEAADAVYAAAIDVVPEASSILIWGCLVAVFGIGWMRRSVRCIGDL